ncbi:5-formyltetrahydrofolate cyclo-ligase [Hydromonas duriensis]|uniref:5-formyltetrahydrofolate cyclo-ligase n=1 Tax=Hydromonas duriensis TaxID=1527608 RepID=A0A4R6YB49_9BURK|nr:5-formyltetrahydrofolate cyclo-ligase [Hydromonas duriensis]TDR32776.1 5-formyltetrahydrofolate cyclo-ligase [Hydromonas duriensis]
MVIHKNGIVTANADRGALRSQLLSARMSLPQAEKGLLDARLCALLSTHLKTVYGGFLESSDSMGAKTIALYWPIRGEPDLMPLAHDLLDAGWQVLLPVVLEKHAPLRFAAYSSQMNLNVGAYGILEPDERDIVDCIPHVVVIPCVGFNAANYRLGYGGGYYDRTLASWRHAVADVHTVGVAYAAGCVDFAASEFDIPMDVILAV